MELFFTIVIFALAMKKAAKHIEEKALHPGFRIKAELKKMGLTQKGAAAILEMQPSHLSELVRGRRNITKAIASKMETLLPIPALEWLRMQAVYDYQCHSEVYKDDSEIEAERLLAEYNTIYDMRIIFRTTDKVKERPSERLAFCKDFLHFGTPSEQARITQGRFHKSGKTGLDTRMIATWSVLAMYEAEQKPMPIGVFKREKCDELGNKLEIIFSDNHNTLNRTERVLSEYGIKFSVVPKIPHASIDGFAFYTQGIPCIVVTKRFDRIDNLAFAVLHELGHLKLHLSQDDIGKVTVINPEAEKIEREELEANEYATNLLIPDSLWNTLPPMKLYPRFIQAQVTKWARANNKNKWIVLGRISHETNIYMFKSDETRCIH